jgi:hypothetical protein
MYPRRSLATAFEVACVCAGALGGETGCDRFRDPPPVPFEVAIHVDSDPGFALPGAVIVRNGKDWKTTGADGRAMLKLPGKEGDSYDFYVRCPADYQSPSKPVTVVLRRLLSNKPPEYTASCPPNVRKVVVAVRTENGAFLPVTYLGKVVARTDASGAAHLLLAMRPGDQFELGLDTSEKGRERLRPKSPTAVFQVKPRDDIQLFEVKFALDKEKPVYRAPPQQPQRPQRL